MLDRDGRNQVGLAVNIKRHRVLVDFPLCVQGDIVSDGVCGFSVRVEGEFLSVGRVPSAERIARMGGLGRFGNGAAIFDLFGFGSGGLAGVEIKCHRVLVDFPLCVQGDFVGIRGNRNIKIEFVSVGAIFIRVPALESITSFSGVSRLFERRTIGYVFDILRGCVETVTVDIKLDDIRLRNPFCRKM